MKIMFLAIQGKMSPQFEVELELISHHLAQNDSIYLVTCSGNLPTCDANYKHKKTDCFTCKERFNEGIKILNDPNITISYLQQTASKENLEKIPKDFSGIQELKNFELFGINFGSGVACSLISVAREHVPDVVFYKDWIYKALVASLIIYESMVKEIQTVKPDILYLHNARFSLARIALQVSRKLGCCFRSYDMGPSGYVFFENYLPHELSDSVKKEIKETWEKSSLSEAEKINIGESFFIRNTEGVFVKDQEKNKLPISFDSKKKNIVIFNSSLDEIESFSIFRVYKSEIDGIEKIVQSFEKNESTQIYVRVHPNLKNLNNTQMNELKLLNIKGYKNLEIIWPEEDISSYSLLRNCDKVIVFNSTMGVEATYWGKPSIVLNEALYESLDCVYLPKSPEEAIRLIHNDIPPKESFNTLKYGFWVCQKRIAYTIFDASKLTILGKKVKPKISLKNKLKLKIYSILDARDKRRNLITPDNK